MNIIFLDIDGVFNCQLFYTEERLKKEGDYPVSEICKTRMRWFNELCEQTGAKVVISSTWRMGRTVEQLRELLGKAGATFEIIDKTPVFRDSHTVRGNEIKYWIDSNIELLYNIKAYNFETYAIIDDDSDMLLCQRNNFFPTDNYSGLTPTTCYKIKRFFLKKYE